MSKEICVKKDETRPNAVSESSLMSVVSVSAAKAAHYGPDPQDHI